MHDDYDLFEILPDHSVRFCASVRGRRHALEQLEILGMQTANECFAARVLDHEILGRVNQRLTARVPR